MRSAKGIQRAVDTNTCNTKRQTGSRTWILSWCDNTVECLMVRSFSGVTPLSLIHTVKTLRICLDYGAPINSIVDAEGNTLLHIAAMHDRCEMIEELLQRGAKADILNEKGWAASHAAVDKAMCALFRLCCAIAAADVITQRDKSGKTCLDHAYSHRETMLSCSCFAKTSYFQVFKRAGGDACDRCGWQP